MCVSHSTFRFFQAALAALRLCLPSALLRSVAALTSTRRPSRNGVDDVSRVRTVAAGESGGVGKAAVEAKEAEKTARANQEAQSTDVDNHTHQEGSNSHATVDPLSDPLCLALLRWEYRRRSEGLRRKLWLPLREGGCLLLGVADPSGLLQPGQVFFQPWPAHAARAAWARADVPQPMLAPRRFAGTVVAFRCARVRLM